MIRRPPKLTPDYDRLHVWLIVATFGLALILASTLILAVIGALTLQ